MASIVKKTGSFFRNVVIEMKKVSWPTRKELVNYTATVVVTVIFLAVFFLLIDLGISELLRLVTNE
ncbi:preprotein translocase subunit SecE [Scopulibacillus daqui]|uniref:Protein translocase subunit SecE n=1 Tax=Scopulibacillus daqui TaxID=1469162 RepID=A0ABS2Q362_9BACL|nr:preprotein translocase subunit SecE [Scopulibacillus daqui]MBM7646737.1 preprotein translocase subunit SecE [Scopulibacillus daqui]